MDNLAIENSEGVQYNSPQVEFVPQILIPADDEELEQLLNQLGM